MKKMSKLFIIAIPLLILIALGYFLIVKDKELQNPRKLDEDIEVVKREFKDFNKDNFIDIQEDIKGDIDILSFETLDAGVTEEFLFVDVQIVDKEVDVEDALAFSVGYEEQLMKELESAKPIQLRLFSSKQHQAEESPLFVYNGEQLYEIEEATVENKVEYIEDDESTSPVLQYSE